MVALPPAYNHTAFTPFPGFSPPSSGLPRPAFSPPFTPPDALSLSRQQQRHTAPNVQLNGWQRFTLPIFHPRLAWTMRAQPGVGQSGQSLPENVYMYARVANALDSTARRALKTLLAQGVLHNRQSEDGRSTLAHLYALLTTPRAPGYQPNALLTETVEILGRPADITQKFGPLSPAAEQAILQVRNYPNLMQPQADPPPKPLQAADLQVESSNTCVASSVMYYMADKEPSEFVRHINELTSPMHAFLETVTPREISPDNPADALNILQQNRIPYSQTPDGKITVRVENPPAGSIRAIDSQKNPVGGQVRSGVEAAYQSALTFLATRSYDPATDLRDADAPGETSKGLTESEKTLMETIVKENGGVASVTYQAVSGKANPLPGEEGNSYLYGYNRPFEKTVSDLLQSLKMSEPVVIGTTDTDQSGAIVTGHEITVTGAFVDPKDQQLKFIVADSDDGQPGTVVKSARELIPTIHHAGLPLKLAQSINQELQANQGNYFVPDPQDATQFQLLSRETGPMPADPANSPVPPPAYAPAFPVQPFFRPAALGPAYPVTVSPPFRLVPPSPLYNPFVLAARPVFSPYAAPRAAFPGVAPAA